MTNNNILTRKNSSYERTIFNNDGSDEHFGGSIRFLANARPAGISLDKRIQKIAVDGSDGIFTVKAAPIYGTYRYRRQKHVSYWQMLLGRGLPLS